MDIRTARWIFGAASLTVTAFAALFAGGASPSVASSTFVVWRYASATDLDSNSVLAPPDAAAATVQSGGASLAYVETSNAGELQHIQVNASVSGGRAILYEAQISLSSPTPIRVHGTLNHTGGGVAAFELLSAGGTSKILEEYACQSCPSGSTNVLDVTKVLQGQFVVFAWLDGLEDVHADLNVAIELGSTLPALSIGDAVELEGAAGANNSLSFPVSLSAPAPTGGATVAYGTSDINTQAGTDYQVTAGVLTFLQGETAKTIVVPIVGDGQTEPDETLQVTLSNPAGATISDATGTGTILNDDTLVDFDWSMPDRFGLDANGNSLIDYYTTAAAISPSSWRVDFTYGSGQVCDPALQLAIEIDGVPVSPSDPALLAVNTQTCTASYAFPAEKKYSVTFELSGPGGPGGQVTHDVTVQDWLIISLGDSVASGEGNPDIPGTPVWENRQCHRSASAGPAQAALAIERADPKTSVTFVHLACSGASVFEGILTRYRGQEPGAWIPPQVDQMDSLVGSREIDAVTISAGANDVRFATVVTGCFLQRDCHLASTRFSMLAFFNGWLPLLPGNYDALALTLRQPRYDVAPDRTYITEYYDALRDDAGAFCDQVILEENRNLPIIGISAAESQWASTDMMVRLNQQVAAGASRNGWKFVGGMYAAFRTHGYCAVDRWIVQLTESLAGQRNPDGTIHPNEVGHAFYAARLVAALTADLYTAGDLTKPRLPR